MPYHLADASANTHRFIEGPYSRVPKELSCAFTASFLVSPLVSIIDKAIVKEISGIGHLGSEMAKACQEMIVKPRAFFGGLSFRLTFIVYFGTYSVANLSEAALDYYRIRDQDERKTWKVSMASGANIGLLAWRDSVFAREFSRSGTHAPKTMPPRAPLRTLGLFAARDCVTMTSTFYVAPKVSQHLIQEHGYHKEVAEVSTALCIPVISQFLTAPIHIHAIDYYTRQHATTAERFMRLKDEMGKVCFARGLRILPAFGIGSYSNNKFRELTIRQPNEELLLRAKIAHKLHLSDLDGSGQAGMIR